MALVSIRVNPDLLQEMRKKAHILHLSQTEYIRKAIALMNQETEKWQCRKKLMRASLRARKSSLEVNAEFDRIERDVKD